MSEGRQYLEKFHQSQIAYYDTFSKWESNNRHKLVKICIHYYLELEAKCFTVIHTLDPRQLEFYEGFANQQITLKKKIEDLLPDEGLEMLENDVTRLRQRLESNKWLTASEELLTHELGLNPLFNLQAEACSVRPKRDIDIAVAALANEPPDVEPMQELLEQICTQLALFTQRNQQQVTQLHQAFNKQVVRQQIETLGLKQGFYKIINSLIEKIKELESPGHVPETIQFQNALNSLIEHSLGSNTVLIQSLTFIYGKLSQINLECINFYINQLRGTMMQVIVPLEQKNFQEHLNNSQFNLAQVLSWIDKFVLSPGEYRLSTAILCSKHVGSYVTHAVLLSVLQQLESSILQTIPETFYLDRIRIMHWHTRYQHIIFTAASLSYLERFCFKYGVKLSSDELLSQKDKLITALATNVFVTDQERADHLIFTLQELLIKQKKQLDPIDKSTLRTLIEGICEGSNPVLKLMNKRIGDQLSFYFLKGQLPPHSQTQATLFGLQNELNQLGQEILPVLRLHAKVHGSFYQQRIEERLWSPLFVNLRKTQPPEDLTPLLAPEEHSIKSAHTSLHKLAFLLSGLAIIQQTVVYADMWNLNVRVKNTTLKNLAYSFGLVEMVHHSDVTKEVIKKRLMKLMRHVAEEQEVEFNTENEQHMAKMFALAEKEQTVGYKAFIDELIGLYRPTILRNKEPSINLNNLIAEFKEEIQKIGTELKDIILHIKQHHMLNDVEPISQPLPIMRSGGAAAIVQK
jgi:hypothetical protein